MAHIVSKSVPRNTFNGQQLALDELSDVRGDHQKSPTNEKLSRCCDYDCDCEEAIVLVRVWFRFVRRRRLWGPVAYGQFDIIGPLDLALGCNAQR